MASDIRPVAGSSKVFRKPTCTIVPLSEAATTYLTETRKLSKETLESYRVGCTKGGNIAIPFFDEKDVRWLVKFRHATGGLLLLKDPRKPDDDGREVKTYIEKGGKPVLLGSQLCDPTAGPLIISFGDYDAMSIYEAGVPNSVSLPFGDSGYDWIREQWDFLQSFDQIVLYTDIDTYRDKEAELKAKKNLEELAERLGKHRLRLVTLKAKRGTKDPNELLIKHGVEAVFKAVDEAEWFPEQDLVSVADYREEPFNSGRRTGFSELDRRTGGFNDGHLVLIGGDNGAGKTTLVMKMIAEHVEHEIPVFAWSGEQGVGKLRYWFERIAAGSTWLTHVRGKDTGFDHYFPKEEILPYVRDWYRDYFFQYANFFTDAEKFFKVAELAVRRYGVKLIVIDNLMAFTGGEGDNYFQSQGDFAQSCKMFAETWGVTVVLIVHNRKAERIKDPAGTVPDPSKDDVEGSKKVTNWADLIIQHFRVPIAAKESHPDWLGLDAGIKVVKCRETGDLFTVRALFEVESMRLVARAEEAKLTQAYSWLKDFEESSLFSGQ